MVLCSPPPPSVLNLAISATVSYILLFSLTGTMLQYWCFPVIDSYSVCNSASVQFKKSLYPEGLLCFGLITGYVISLQFSLLMSQREFMQIYFNLLTCNSSFLLRNAYPFSFHSDLYIPSPTRLRSYAGCGVSKSKAWSEKQQNKAFYSSSPPPLQGCAGGDAPSPWQQHPTGRSCLGWYGEAKGEALVYSNFKVLLTLTAVYSNV